MPIYEYRRPDGTTFEVLQKFSDDALTHDPESGEPVQRVLSAPAIHFKGSGFHNTDYGTRKRPVGGDSSSSSDGGASKSDGASSGGSDGGSSSSTSDGGSSAKKDGSSSTATSAATTG